MTASEFASLITGGVGCSVIVVLSYSSISRILKSASRPERQADGEIPDFYEDEDGTATEETENAFSDKLPRVLVALTTTAGLLISLALAVFGAVRPHGSLPVEAWISFAAWILLSIQAISLFIERQSVRRYTVGVYGAISCIILITVIGVENGLFTYRVSSIRRYTAHIVLTSFELLSAVLTLFFHLSLPRRPDVSQGEHLVDRQYTVSAISRYTFTWANSLLKYAAVNKGLDLHDLPCMDHLTRSDYLQKNFNRMKKRDRLWKSIYFAHASAFIQQWVLVIVQAIAQFAPQLAMFHILKLLEARQTDAPIASVAWAWVATLGLAMIIQSWLESWLFWVIWANIGIIVRQELSALIFMKAMRKKDVKETGKAESHHGEQDPASTQLPISPGETTGVEDDEDDQLQKSRQSTINLVGVDAKRVSDFTTFNYIFPGAVCKLIVSIIFLVKLIGWPSLLAGLAVTLFSTPVNVYCSRKYSTAQSNLMKVRDQKMAVVTEALQGIRQIKFSALEQQWQSRIGRMRHQELKTQWKVFQLNTVLICIWILGPVMLSAVALAVYSILHGDLSPSVAFTTIAVFGQIESTLAIIPELTTDSLDAWVSLKRIEDYLNTPEKVDNTTQGDTITFDNATVAWPADGPEVSDDRFGLRNISLTFPNKELSVVSGRTGSGKSLLLASILGEADVLEGTVKVPKAPSLHDRYDHMATREDWLIPKAIAFVSQIPWIENATIKDNILFGLPFDGRRYHKVLSSCALEKDLDMLPDGELTEIGANGINLSGGQRWRVTFARALYSRAGILILDDIFSAVDAHVGRQLFDEALTGDLGKGRTRILVTHHVALCLPETAYSVHLSEGTVEHAGFVTDLKRTGSLADILKRENELQGEEETEVEAVLQLEGVQGVQDLLHERSEQFIKVDESELNRIANALPKKFTEEEQRETGSIKLGVYKEYFKTSGGSWFWISVLMTYTAYMALVLGRSWWVSLWTRSYGTESVLARHLPYRHTSLQYVASAQATADENDDLWFYLGIYVGLSVVICALGTLRYLWVFYGSIRASRTLFENLTHTVLRAPLRWLDTVPVGRVLNRFTTDFNVIDSRMAADMGFMLYNVLQLMGIIIAGLFVSPYMILFAVGLVLICLHFASRYLVGAREVKRLESNAKSPIFEQFGSVLTGLGTIRAFDKAETYIERMFAKIDDHARTYWYLWLFNRWMGFRLNIVGAIFAIVVASVIVSTKNIDAALAGFALGFALQYTTAVVWTLRQYANMELNMNATERVVDYSGIATEDLSGNDAPAAWPTEGRLEVTNLVAAYAADLPPVLKGLTFQVERNQRVGVVGRTGAGKSSLTLALFRFLEARSGMIRVDGLDISKMKLHDLRSRLAIIPQDPVLFSGTVRSNLDAFDQHTDAELRDALERVHLIRSSGSTCRSDPTVASTSTSGTTTPIVVADADADANTNIFRSLRSRISEGGLNLSQGQRQLLCLARAIVSRPKVMVLDEATSAVDMHTDVLIQRSIREEFGDSTLLVIAHRLSTIADFDKILVMSDGRAVEYGEPRRLLEAKGAFWRMVRESGERGRLEEIILGSGGGVGRG